MTGRELIQTILKYNAENMQIVIQYRDGGGDYDGGEIIESVNFADYKETNNSFEVYIDYSSDKPTCLVL